MPTTAKQIEKELEQAGWFLAATKGSHRQYKHPDKAGRVTVPWHKNGKADLKIGTEKSIRRQAGI